MQEISCKDSARSLKLIECSFKNIMVFSISTRNKQIHNPFFLWVLIRDNRTQISSSEKNKHDKCQKIPSKWTI